MSSYIPTLGNQSYADNIFLMRFEGSIKRESSNSCFLDIESCNGLSRVINGGIMSYQDVIGAEATLHALVWHDQVDIIIPSFLLSDIFNKDNSFYKRTSNPLNDIYEILNLVKGEDSTFISKDALFPVEYGFFDKDFIIQKTNFPTSILLGKKTSGNFENYLEECQLQQQGLCYIPKKSYSPTYFTNTFLSNTEESLERYLHNTLNEKWLKNNNVKCINSSQIILPPLLSILFNRAKGSHLGIKNREKLLKELLILRGELKDCRSEMKKLSNLFSSTKCISQKDLINEEKVILESFNKIVESVFYEKKSFVGKILKISQETIQLEWKNAINSIFEILRIVDDKDSPFYWTNKTTTAKKLSELLNIQDNLFFLTEHFFTQQELQNIRNSSLSIS
ncbi:MAG: hypothetical protein WCJ84_02350 [Candidatus Peregrinibacteria bacterium]